MTAIYNFEKEREVSNQFCKQSKRRRKEPNFSQIAFSELSTLQSSNVGFRPRPKLRSDTIFCHAPNWPRAETKIERSRLTCMPVPVPGISAGTTERLNITTTAVSLLIVGLQPRLELRTEPEFTTALQKGGSGKRRLALSHKQSLGEGRNPTTARSLLAPGRTLHQQGPPLHLRELGGV